MAHGAGFTALRRRICLPWDFSSQCIAVRAIHTGKSRGCLWRLLCFGSRGSRMLRKVQLAAGSDIEDWELHHGNVMEFQAMAPRYASNWIAPLQRPHGKDSMGAHGGRPTGWGRVCALQGLWASCKSLRVRVWLAVCLVQAIPAFSPTKTSSPHQELAVGVPTPLTGKPAQLPFLPGTGTLRHLRVLELHKVPY